MPSAQFDVILLTDKRNHFLTKSGLWDSQQRRSSVIDCRMIIIHLPADVAGEADKNLFRWRLDKGGDWRKGPCESGRSRKGVNLEGDLCTEGKI